MSGLFAAGLILLGLAAIAGRFQRSWPYLLGAAGSACLAVLGGFALAGRTVRLDVAGWLGDPVPGQQAAALAADQLSGLFLLLAFGAAVPVSVAFAIWAARTGPARRRGLGASYALALGAVAVIVTAQDAFTVLFGWETLTLAFYLLAGAERNKPGRAGAAQLPGTARQVLAMHPQTARLHDGGAAQTPGEDHGPMRRAPVPAPTRPFVPPGTPLTRRTTRLPDHPHRHGRQTVKSTNPADGPRSPQTPTTGSPSSSREHRHCSCIHAGQRP